jgi:hypothetical protein
MTAQPMSQFWIVQRAGARYLVERSESISGGRIVRQLP